MAIGATEDADFGASSAALRHKRLFCQALLLTTLARQPEAERGEHGPG